MNSHDFGKKIILYLYEELSNKERAKLERHLKKCPNCRLGLEELRETRGAFQGVETLSPSPSCKAAVFRLVREKLILKDSWLNRIRSFPERMTLRIPRPVTVGFGILILLIALSFYISYEKAPFLSQEKELGKIAKWENGVEDSLELLAGEVKRIKGGEDLLSLLIIEERISFDEEIINLEKDIFYLSSELNAI